MQAVAAEDERRHNPGPEQLWGESWYFDFSAPDGSLGGYVRLGLYPNLGVAWYWAALVGRGRRLVMVRDHELQPPRGRDLEVRGDGIWSAVNCETPLDHWSIGLEAFAVALDDPFEAYRSERGDRIGLGFDLEWEATASAAGLRPGWYGQPCRVSGEILVADEQLAFDGTGYRSHRWGVDDWWGGGSHYRASGVLDDGTHFAIATADRDIGGNIGGDIGGNSGGNSGGDIGGDGNGRATMGYVSGPGHDGVVDEVGIANSSTPAALELAPGLATMLGQADLPAAATLMLGAFSLVATVLAPAPLRLEGPDGRSARLARSWCRYQAGDGRAGVGWAEWLHPQTEPI